MAPAGRPLNAALVGLGMVADMHARAVAESGSATLRGVFARRRSQADEFAGRHGGLGVYASFDELIADEALDFVILATPPDARRDYVRRLAAAGLPILIEKPIERDYGRAEEIVELCEAAGAPLGVVLQHRMRPAARLLSARIGAGALGDIATVEMRVPWWRDQAYYDAPGRGEYARDGGGVLITQAIHTIDLMLSLCGPVEEVVAMTTTSALHRMEAEDFAAAALRFRSGAVGSLTASTTHFPGGADEIVLNGVRGSASLAADTLSIRPYEGVEEAHCGASASGGGADPMAFSHAWHQAVVEDFACAVRAGRAPAITGRSALAAQALIDAIALSARLKRAVSMEDIHG
ncbi:MAG: Gfo/Idh/MocA family oxidoreductase [Pseudomonadota bacterium]